MANPLLQPGQRAPHFRLPSVNMETDATLDGGAGRPSIVIFVPTGASDSVLQRLGQFQARFWTEDAEAPNLVCISDSSVEELRQLSQSASIRFALASDPTPQRGVCESYGVLVLGHVFPTVFVIDPTGIVRRVYEGTQYPDLPNPSMVARALFNAGAAPRPNPITSADWRHGPEDAPVVLIEYSDYECGHCRDLHFVLERVLPSFPNVLLVHRHLPIRSSHPHAQLAAEAAEAAGTQGKFWQMHHSLFQANGRLDTEDLIQYARELELDPVWFASALERRDYQEAVNEDFTTAVQIGIKVPPTLFINGRRWEGALTEEGVREALPQILGAPERNLKSES